MPAGYKSLPIVILIESVFPDVCRETFFHHHCIASSLNRSAFRVGDLWRQGEGVIATESFFVGPEEKWNQKCSLFGRFSTTATSVALGTRAVDAGAALVLCVALIYSTIVRGVSVPIKISNRSLQYKYRVPSGTNFPQIALEVGAPDQTHRVRATPQHPLSDSNPFLKQLGCGGALR